MSDYNICPCSSNRITIVTCSISGGSFAKQLGLMCDMFARDMDSIPKVWMGCSGGALACWIALHNDLDPIRIREYLLQLDHSTYSKHWILGVEGWRGMLARWITRTLGSYGVPLSYSSLRQGGRGLPPNINNGLLDSIELWMGLLDYDTGKFLTVCNKSRDVLTKISAVNPDDTINITPEMSLRSYVEAATVIPGYVDPPLIGDRRLMDGGLTWPTPLTHYIEQLRGKNIAVIHFGYGDTETYTKYRGQSKPWPMVLRNIFTQVNSVRIAYELQLIREMLLQYADAYGMIMVDRMWIRPTELEIKNIMTIHKESPSLLDVFALSDDDPDLFTFTGTELVRSMENVKDNIGVRAWWLIPTVMMGTQSQ